MQLLIRTSPLVRLIHHENHLTRFRVLPDHIDHTDPIWFRFLRIGVHCASWTFGVGRWTLDVESSTKTNDQRSDSPRSLPAPQTRAARDVRLRARDIYQQPTNCTRRAPGTIS